MGMNPDVKREWVDALESHEYQQGKGQLRAGDEYCCLGVLCDLAVKAGVIAQADTPSDMVQYGEADPETGEIRGYSGSVSYLPEAVRVWAGLDEQNPYVQPYVSDADPYLARYAGNNVWLSNLNDSDYGYGFDKIARIIDQYL